jgi:hypothetical protein
VWLYNTGGNLKENKKVLKRASWPLITKINFYDYYVLGSPGGKATRKEATRETKT